MKSRLLPLMVLLGVGLLAGCGSSSKQGLCPGMAALADAASQPMFRQAGSIDPSNVLYTVQIVHVTGGCDVEKKAKSATTSLDIHFRATRAPTGEAATYTVPYFLAVTQADRIINKQTFEVRLSFAPGAAVAEATDTVSSTVIKPTEGKYPWDYQILAGLPLTKEQLDYNRTIGRFTQ